MAHRNRILMSSHAIISAACLGAPLQARKDRKKKHAKSSCI